MVDEYVELGPVELAGTWQVARGQWIISEDEQEFTCSGYLVEGDPNKDALCLSSVRMTDGVLAAEIMVTGDRNEKRCDEVD